ncbi:predicted protein [Histoplasma mississippiense (nom. inval.)]|uniref:predicted protein n=1 Tax=Ajellomyces capsulatus (strain NAm1 / WU24) TaxID=2059318 RepID=UPI000157D3EE|nr:predicted protein [Histoplasma mississippiense (nom. inval.)]EDN04825.1 predicted protein [Histoplasma mississippiense (nom. inval.)]
MASMDPSSSSPGDEPMTQNKWPASPTSRQNNKGKESLSSDRGLGKGHSKLQPGSFGDWATRAKGLNHHLRRVTQSNPPTVQVRPFSSQLMLPALAGLG